MLGELDTFLLPSNTRTVDAVNELKLGAELNVFTPANVCVVVFIRPGTVPEADCMIRFVLEILAPLALGEPSESIVPIVVTPPPPVVAIVIFDPLGVTLIPVPATRVSAPVRLFRLETPDPPPL
jgi:hypothetical protein